MTRLSRTYARGQLLAAALSALALLVLIPTAASASVISDCTADNSIDGSYSASELNNALKNMPADVDQYYGCSDLIRQALLNKADKNRGKKDSSSSMGGGALLAAATSEQREQAERKAEKAVAKAIPSHGQESASGGGFDPTSSKTLASSTSPGTPVAMLVALAGLLLLILGELAARGAKMPAVKKFVNRSGSSDASN